MLQAISWSKEKFCPLLLISKLLPLQPPARNHFAGAALWPLGGLAVPGLRDAFTQPYRGDILTSSIADLGWVRTPWGADEARGASLSASPHVYDVSFPRESPDNCSCRRGCSCTLSGGQKSNKEMQKAEVLQVGKWPAGFSAIALHRWPGL